MDRDKNRANLSTLGGEKVTKYCIETVVDHGNEAFKDGVKHERKRIRALVEKMRDEAEAEFECQEEHFHAGTDGSSVNEVNKALSRFQSYQRVLDLLDGKEGAK